MYVGMKARDRVWFVRLIKRDTMSDTSLLCLLLKCIAEKASLYLSKSCTSSRRVTLKQHSGIA